MKFSYSAVWADTVALARAHGPLVVAIAAVFFLLPSLGFSYLLPPPETADIRELLRQLIAYAGDNWPWLIARNLVEMIGGLAILKLVFERGITVGGAIAGAMGLILTYFVASFASSFLIFAGLALLVVPGLYLMGRLAPLGPVVAAEKRRNPVDALTRSFALTRERGWAVFGLIFLVMLAAGVLSRVINTVLGSVLILAAGKELGRLLALIVGCATGAAVATLLFLLYAAIYRQLAAAEPSGAAAAAGRAAD
jgi:hypothetical protein